MHLGAFELTEPLPELRSPHLIASLTPWIDAGSVGSLSLERLERYMGAKDIGGLSNPGRYFDFTRYRPVMYYENDERKMKIPNAELRYAIGPRERDFLFLHMLEPHNNAEEYIDALVQVIQHLNVGRYVRIGAMYDAVPHTRPLLVMGTLDGRPLEGAEGVEGNRRRPYQGPTSIMNMVGDRLSGTGVENMMLMCRLPHYVELEADFAGRTKMLQVLCGLYHLPEDYWVSRRDQYQYGRITTEMESNTQIQTLVKRLEADYDAKRGNRRSQRERDEGSKEAHQEPLPPSIEAFLRELDQPTAEDSE